MAIKPGYKTFKFDNKSAGSYGVYITGSGVYNAPQRDVEMITIPGRNGTFTLDNGRFENIEVTYPAGLYAESQEEMAQMLSDFRNYLCSREGYVRLEDEYNPDEYRLAIYKSGLEVDPAKFQRAAEFNIVFDCKPQRFLASGEKPISVESGDTVTNPTQFGSSPLLEVEGYGEIDLGSSAVAIHNEPIGEVIVFGAADYKATSVKTITFDDTYAEAGDPIFLSLVRFVTQFLSAPSQFQSVVTTTSGDIDSYEVDGNSNSYIHFRHYMMSKQLDYGTPQTLTGATTISWTYGGEAKQIVVNMTVDYDGSNGITITNTVTVPSGVREATTSLYPVLNLGDIKLDSSQPSLGNPLYIDLDLGEAYKIESGSFVSVNNAVDIPAELPKLEPGANTITFDNTITDLKVVPRWWRV